MRRIVLALVVIVAFCVAPASARDAKEDAKMMEGTWLPVSGEFAGAKMEADFLKALKLVIKDGKYTVEAGKTTDVGTLTLDVGKKPKTMDILGTEGPNKDKTILTIYELSEDTLKVCYDLDGKERPKEFKTKEGSKLMLITYKRQKP